MSVIGFRHAGIVVQDLDAMIHFYVDLLGLKVWRKSEESGPNVDDMLALRGAHVTTVKLTDPNGIMIELLQFKSHPPKEPEERWIHDTGLTHLALTISRIDEEYERLRRAGVEFLSPPRVSGSAKVAFAIDPEGGYVELVEVLH